MDSFRNGDEPSPLHFCRVSKGCLKFARTRRLAAAPTLRTCIHSQREMDFCPSWCECKAIFLSIAFLLTGKSTQQVCQMGRKAIVFGYEYRFLNQWHETVSCSTHHQPQPPHLPQPLPHEFWRDFLLLNNHLRHTITTANPTIAATIHS